MKFSLYVIDEFKLMMTESVFCLSTKALEKAGFLENSYITFIKPEIDIERLLSLEFKFIPRSIAEGDVRWKQVIPYQVFICNNTLFAFQRGDRINEKRLIGCLSIGIGGHINLTDLKHSASLKELFFKAALRERDEELEIKADVSTKLIGLINDDSNSVGKVHIGVVMACKIDNPNSILIRQDSEDIKFYNWLTAPYILSHKSYFEVWSTLATLLLLKTGNLVNSS